MLMFLAEGGWKSLGMVGGWMELAIARSPFLFSGMQEDMELMGSIAIL